MEAVKGYRFHFDHSYRTSKLEYGAIFFNIRQKVNVRSLIICKETCLKACGSFRS